MPVLRIEKTKDYTVMSNYHLRDKGISLKAKGLLSYMLSLPDYWEYSISGLAAICKEGPDCIRATVQELESAGYITRSRVRAENGRLGGTEYVVREFPTQKKPMQENPAQVTSTQDVTRQINTNQTSTISINNVLKNNTPLSPKGKKSKSELPVPSQSETGFSDKMQEAFEDWLAYKKERREPYKETGLKTLLKKLKTSVDQHGEEAVIDMLTRTIAAGYQGPVWDWLKKAKPKVEQDPWYYDPGSLEGSL